MDPTMKGQTYNISYYKFVFWGQFDILTWFNFWAIAN